MPRPTRPATTLAAVLATAAFAGTDAGSTASQAQDLDAIWALEQSIYSGGSGGANLARYLDSMDPEYAGWPPQVDQPLGYSHMAEAAAAAKGRGGVELSMSRNLVRVHRDGDVALAFYTTHRTRRAGAAVDESFETLHVWIKKEGSWKLFGAMVRETPPTRAVSTRSGG